MTITPPPWLAAAVVAVALVCAEPAAAHVDALTAGPSASVSVAPEADTTVRQDLPAATAGGNATLYTDATPAMRSYLRFRVKGITGRVLRATLRVAVRNAAGRGIAVAGTGAGWDEKTLNWDSAPAVGDAVDTSGPTAAAGTADLDVTPLVTGDGPVAVAVTTDGDTRVGMASREDPAAPPRLVVEYSDTTPPGPPVGLGAKVAGDTVALHWQAAADADLADYRIYRRAGDEPWSGTPIGVATASAWTDDAVVIGTTYEYRVTAVDTAGNESMPSDPVSATAGRQAGELTFPVRAAFYQPYYPEGWMVSGTHVFYNPTLGYYDSADVAAVDEHIRALEYGGIDAAIAAWSGPNTHKEAARLRLLLDRTKALGSNLKWSLYYEKEAASDPSVDELRADLAYIKANYADRAEYAHVAGKPVLFVYNSGDLNCDVANRWKQAAGDRWYLVLKVVPGYTGCSAQPDAWHQYAPSSGTQVIDKSFAISPGFWRANEPAPRLARDEAEWRARVRQMVASGKPWQLVTTFNQWGQGTAVESAREWQSPSGRGSYLDALHTDGAEPRPDPVVAAAGDIADADPDAERTAEVLDALAPDRVLTVGDNAYTAGTALQYSNFYDPTWGRFKDRTSPVPGNHEYATPGAPGYFGYFGSAAGDPATGYYAYDLGSWRLYALNSNVPVSATSAQLQWLRADLAANPRACVLAYWHHPRFTAGQYADNARYQPLWQALQDAGAEVVLAGHDHSYQRYTPMRPDGTPDAAGIREFVVGTGGRSHYPLTQRTDGRREVGDATTFGVLALTLKPDGYEWRFAPVAGGAFADSGSARCH
jgi:hypothetical protein